MIYYRCCFLTLACSLFLVDSAWGTFHLMQIEQIIGGVNGDTSAQAVQLRTRSAGQNFVASSRVTAVDATGSNSVLLEDMTHSVPHSQAGRRILLATPNFANYTNIPFVPDFVMDPIPASYLAAGQVRFTDDVGTILWSLSWGGDSYTGSTAGTTNDNNGDFGPPVNIALPSTGLQALLFTGAASALSTTNLADYALTAGAATFINNAGTSFTLVAPDLIDGDYNGDGIVNAADYVLGRDQIPDFYDDFYNDFGGSTGSGAVALVPEPATVTLSILAVGGLVWRYRASRKAFHAI